jgi:ferritin-like metal-binding protein YciE
MKLNDLNDLLVHELKDIYSAEKQILKALPKMAKAASLDQLKRALEEHRSQTQQQVQRLEQVCEKLDVGTRGAKCAAMEGLIEEGRQMLEEDASPEVLDAAIICSAQRIEHYEIAAYGCVRTFCEQLGHPEEARLLQETLDEECAADQRLTQIATEQANLHAASPA